MTSTEVEARAANRHRLWTVPATVRSTSTAMPEDVQVIYRIPLYKISRSGLLVAAAGSRGDGFRFSGVEPPGSRSLIGFEAPREIGDAVGRKGSWADRGWIPELEPEPEMDGRSVRGVQTGIRRGCDPGFERASRAGRPGQSGQSAVGSHRSEVGKPSNWREERRYVPSANADQPAFGISTYDSSYKVWNRMVPRCRRVCSRSRGADRSRGPGRRAPRRSIVATTEPSDRCGSESEDRTLSSESHSAISICGY